MTRLVVKSHRPWQFALGVVLLSVFFTILTWLVLEYSHWSVIREQNRLGENYKQMLETNRKLEQENRRLYEKVLMLEQTIKLDKQTASLLQDELASQQDEIHQLRGELEFYQGIMESTRDAQGLNIYGIHITPLDAERSFLLRLVLTHVVKGDKVAQGRLKIMVEGSDKDGSTRRYALNELSVEPEQELEFEFKNFKRVERHLTLPAGFEPSRVFVTIQTSGKNPSTLRKVFEWPAVAA